MPQIWRTAGTIAQRLEGDRGFRRPALRRAPHGEIPDRVAVTVPVAFVGVLAVRASADRVEIEIDAVAPVVERVEREPEAFVLADAAAVAAHLVHDHPVGLALERAQRNVDVVAVERDPDLGPLGGGLAGSGLRLDEIGNRRRRACRAPRRAARPRGAAPSGRPHGPWSARSRRARRSPADPAGEGRRYSNGSTSRGAVPALDDAANAGRVCWAYAGRSQGSSEHTDSEIEGVAPYVIHQGYVPGGVAAAGDILPRQGSRP